MKYQNVSWHHAFVIKTQIPYSHKVLLFDAQQGKIWAIFKKNHGASQLSSGSFISCVLEKKQHVFALESIEIERHIVLDEIEFVHDIMRICLHGLPYGVVSHELFDFLHYVYKNMNQFCNQTKKIILLRLFVMCGILDDSQSKYQAVIIDPVKAVDLSSIELEQLIANCWTNLQKNKLIQY
jgi:hypothetical protein